MDSEDQPMIQTRTRNRQLFRLMDERLARKNPLDAPKGILAGGLISAMIWGLLAVVLS